MVNAVNLDITDAVCAFGKTRVVEQANMQIRSGEHVALIGCNGSGKTTLLRAVLGLHPLNEGRITLDGAEAATPSDWKTRRKKIAWMPQRQATGQFPLLVRELLASSASPESAFAERCHRVFEMASGRLREVH